MSVWTIPAGRPFLDSLVAGIFARVGRDPLSLAAVTILLPTRRACRALREAFLRASDGDCLLPPRMSALGDIDADELDLAGGEDLPDGLDLPPAISGLRRQLLLARLIRHWGSRADSIDVLPAQAIALAADLAHLIDQAETEGVPLTGLPGLVPDEHAAHWQITVEFLAIVTEHWPALLAAEGALDPANRRNRLIWAQLARWRAAPPKDPVIAAGFSDASPAVADLLGLIALLPTGSVVLPGVDTAAEPDLWDAIRQDPTHPQHGLARLLSRMGVPYEDVPSWQAGADNTSRVDLAREVMRPAAVTHEWRRLNRLPAAPPTGLTRLDLAGPQEEAGAIALMLRRQLETPGATAMLVTPDRGLARRVARELARWGIDIDDSAGVALNRAPPGVFLRLLGEAALEKLAPVPLLALLKHPLAAAGLPAVQFRDQVRALEIACLRGPRPAPGLAGLRTAAPAELLPLIDRLETALGGFLAAAEAGTVPLAELLAAHIRAAEALSASDDESGADRLWNREAGESLAGFVAELATAATDFEPIQGADYPVLFEALLAGRVVRPRFGKHPRLQILGALEARLQQADLVILGGLNEGVWPPQAPHDPWLSRPMRQELGLPSPEAQVGLAAQDFAMGFVAPEVVLTRAARVEGTPTVPSRWLLRLATVLRAMGIAEMPANGFAAFSGYQALLDKPATIRPCAAPAPRPPVAARPRSLWVTEIETWMRDPYAIYARRILKLDPLDPLDAEAGAADRGTIIHDALDAFVQAYPGALPAHALERLLEIGRRTFGETLARPGVWAFWWPRFERIARWFVGIEAERRPLIGRSATETRGRLVFDFPEGPFTLRAKADRIDHLRAGGLVLIDYKTGTLPDPGDLALGFAPQLPLEAAIAEAGGFEHVPAAMVTELAFWRVSGGDPPGEIVAAGRDGATPSDMAAVARAGLTGLIAAFDDPATPYLALPRPDRAPRFGAYGHLARLQEWGTEVET